MLGAMAIIVFKMVALIFQCIERLIFDLPPSAAPAHEAIDIALTHSDVGHPTEVLDLRRLHWRKPIGMIASFDSQDIVQILGVQGLDMRGIGTQAVFSDDELEVGI